MRNAKKLLIGILTVSLLVLLANTLLSFKIKRTLTLNKQWKVSIGDVHTNILTGKVQLVHVAAHSIHYEKDSISLVARNVSLRGISPMFLLNNEKLSLTSFEWNSPKIIVCQKNIAKDTTTIQEPSGIKKVHIGDVKITDASFSMLNNTLDTLLTVSSIDMDIHNADWTNENSMNGLPIAYEDITASMTAIYVSTNESNELKIAHLNMSKSDLEVTGLKLATIDGKDKFTEKLAAQKDWVSLKVPNINVSGYDVHRRNDTLGLHIKKVDITTPHLSLYRFLDLPPTTVHKPLYSAVLRNLPFTMDVGTIHINKGVLEYAEKVKKNTPSGTLFFSDFDVEISDLHTGSKTDTTLIKLKTRFMKQAPLELEWSFQVNDPTDQFVVTGQMTDLNMTKTNDYLEPILNVRSQGTIQSLFFTISGNNIMATGDVRMQYNDLAFAMIHPDKRTVRKFLTSILNMIIKTNKPKTDVKEVSVAVERNPQKSFFNYFWQCIKKGTLESVR